MPASRRYSSSVVYGEVVDHDVVAGVQEVQTGAFVLAGLKLVDIEAWVSPLSPMVTTRRRRTVILQDEASSST